MISLRQTSETVCIDQLRIQFENGTLQSADWLVIAHHDTLLLDRLQETIDEYNLAVLAIPQSYWSFEEAGSEDLIQFAIEQLGVKGILLVGHSLGGIPEDNVKVDAVSESPNSPNRIRKAMATSFMDRMRSAKRRIDLNERHVREQLAQVTSRPEVESRRNQGKLEVLGLLYRSESGLFYTCNEQSGMFELAENKCTDTVDA